MEFSIEKVSFPCSGTECSGLLYKPNTERETPGIVMAFGFGMIKEIHAGDYGPKFAEAGFTTLIFDYRRFGGSEGSPRQALYPMDQVQDYRCAVNYVKNLDNVDGSRICVWGTSFSGGHVILQLAFPQPGVTCGISQVPNLYSFKTAISYAGSLDPYMQLVEAFRGKACEGSVDHIPIVSREGPSVIRSEEAYDYYMRKASKFPGFKNYITADSLERILTYSPGLYADIVSRPVFLLVASKDKTTPPQYIRDITRVIKPDKEVMEIDGGHFDIYEEPFLSKIVEREILFAKKYLG
ncbi:MAG: alpha/beta hydrolase [Desulfurococcales archaeon]|nr:alpha/beta hydrolase [Desulfurococcales archaeon]